MTFRIGQKVVCVDDGLGARGCMPTCGWPIVGNVYTVSEVGPNHLGGVGVNTVELEHPIRCGWRVSRFRPVVERKTDISFAHEILRKASKRAKVKS